MIQSSVSAKGLQGVRISVQDPKMQRSTCRTITVFQREIKKNIKKTKIYTTHICLINTFSKIIDIID